MMALNRRIYRAFVRVRESNFSLIGLLGFDMNGKTVGIVGTGKIGAIVGQIMKGFDCRLLAYDPFPNEKCREMGISYVELPELLAGSDIVTLHCPLTPETKHLIDDKALCRNYGASGFFHSRSDEKYR
jgi:D-lactate dehydrogenase